MRAARRRLADHVAARQKAHQQLPEPPRDDFDQRLADARAATAPHEPVAYWFVPRPGGFVIKAITVDDLAVAIPGTTLIKVAKSVKSTPRDRRNQPPGRSRLPRPQTRKPPGNGGKSGVFGHNRLRVIV
jgi:hypothetical protein